MFPLVSFAFFLGMFLSCEWSTLNLMLLIVNKTLSDGKPDRVVGSAHFNNTPRQTNTIHVGVFSLLHVVLSNTTAKIVPCRTNPK